MPAPDKTKLSGKTVVTDTGTGGTAATTPVQATTTQNVSGTTLKQGMKSADVSALQQKLKALGYYKGAIDSSYGPQTAAAVKAYQKAKGLTVDAIAGKQTLTSLGLLPSATTTAAKTTTPAKAAATPAKATTTPVQGAVTKPSQQIKGAVTDVGEGTKPSVNPVTVTQYNLQTPTGAKPAETKTETPTGPLQPLTILTPQTDVGEGTKPSINPIKALQYGLNAPVSGKAMEVAATHPQIVPPTTTPSQVPATAPVQATIQKPSETIAKPAVTEPTEAKPIVEGKIPEGEVPEGFPQVKKETIKPTVTEKVGAEGVAPVAGTVTSPATAINPELFQFPELPQPTYSMEEYQPVENPYIEQLNAMQFQYNPFEDEEYNQRAAQYEQQVTDMMVGRGGLYSSVAQNALQAGLISLQQQMMEQRYQEFLNDRNFTLQMAQFVSDENARMFDQFITNKKLEFDQYTFQMEYAFNTAKELWSRYAWGAEMELAKQKEAFSQQMQIAGYNLDVQQAAFNQQFAIDQANWNKYTWQQEFAFSKQKEAFDERMATASYNLSAQNAAFNQKMAMLEYENELAQQAFENQFLKLQQNVQSGENTIKKNVQSYSVASKSYKNILNKWKNMGKADKAVADYFGVSVGSKYSDQESIYKIVQKAQDLDNYKADIYTAANIVGVAKEDLESLYTWYESKKGTGTVKQQGTIKAQVK